MTGNIVSMKTELDKDYNRVFWYTNTSNNYITTGIEGIKTILLKAGLGEPSVKIEQTETACTVTLQYKGKQNQSCVKSNQLLKIMTEEIFNNRL